MRNKIIRVLLNFSIIGIISILVLKGCTSQRNVVVSPQKPVNKNNPTIIIKQNLSSLFPSDSGFVAGEIGKGEGLTSSILKISNVKMDHALEISNVLMERLDFRSLKAGQQFRLKLSADSNVVEKFVFFQNKVKYFVLERDSSGVLTCSENKLATELRQRIVEGVLETSLDRALGKLNLPMPLRQTVNNILECTVSFQTDARAGDVFRLLVEEEFFEDSVFIDGKVLYAAYRGEKTGLHEGFYYEEDDPKSAFNSHYTREGMVLVNTGLRIPVDRVHISSVFGYRIHPITGINTMHNGVDYAGPVGSPVYSACAGKIKCTKYDALGGKQIVIAHADGTETFYLHLNSFNVKQGQSVKSRQIIGSIGNTGRSTGPHLHFGIKQKNEWLNPLSKHMIATPKLEGDKFSTLQKRIIELEAKIHDVITFSEIDKSINSIVNYDWCSAIYSKNILGREKCAF